MVVHAGSIVCFSQSLPIKVSTSKVQRLTFPFMYVKFVVASCTAPAASSLPFHVCWLKEFMSISFFSHLLWSLLQSTLFLISNLTFVLDPFAAAFLFTKDNRQFRIKGSNSQLHVPYLLHYLTAYSLSVRRSVEQHLMYYIGQNLSLEMEMKYNSDSRLGTYPYLNNLFICIVWERRA